jgi:hypothetical protein
MNRSISDNLDRFYTSTYISASVVPPNLFASQVKASVDQFILSTTNNFLLSLSLIRNTTQGNALYSSQLTNYNLYVPDEVGSVLSRPRIYGDCQCLSSPTCGQESAIYNYPIPVAVYTVPNFYVGCQVLESLLQSTLECFYNQTCINILQSYCASPVRIIVTALDPSLSSRYFENSTIQELVNSLMVEEWNSSVTYDSYYDECQPAQCIYTHTTKNDIIYIVTILFGLIGGLITVLKLVVPPLVNFIRKKIKSSRLNTGKTKYSAVFDTVSAYISFRVVSAGREQGDIAVLVSGTFHL